VLTPPPARNLTLRECLKLEFRLVVRFMAPTSDFYEGVSAALIRKDGKPRWSPATLAEVSPETVDSYFQPLTDVQELELLEAKAEAAHSPAAAREGTARRSRL
jgi:Enoyl-CoA hydratase/isomerase